MSEKIMDLQIEKMALEIELEKYKQKCKIQEKRIKALNEFVIKITEFDTSELNYIIKRFEEYIQTIDKKAKDTLPLIELKVGIKAFAEKQKQTREDLILMMKLEEKINNKDI